MCEGHTGMSAVPGSTPCWSPLPASTHSHSSSDASALATSWGCTGTRPWSGPTWSPPIPYPAGHYSQSLKKGEGRGTERKRWQEGGRTSRTTFSGGLRESTPVVCTQGGLSVPGRENAARQALSAAGWQRTAHQGRLARSSVFHPVRTFNAGRMEVLCIKDEKNDFIKHSERFFLSTIIRHYSSFHFSYFSHSVDLTHASGCGNAK